MKRQRINDTEHLPQYAKSVYLDLICSGDALADRLEQAHKSIVSDVGQRAESIFGTLRLTKASVEMTNAKLTELLEGPGGSFSMYQTDNNVDGALLLAAARALSPYVGAAGFSFSEDHSVVYVDGFGEMEIDDKGYVRTCPVRPNLRGMHVLSVLAAFVNQDFGVVLHVCDKLRYAFDCSAFEKTPKDVESGHNHFVGLDFLEWHRRIPRLGKPLAELFGDMDKAFAADTLDLFTIDLRGRNLYTDGNIVVHRYERDYVVPLRLPDGKYLGFVNFADVFMKDIGEETRPQLGGAYFDVGCPKQFHHEFAVIKHAAYRDHPTGIREGNDRL